jgi:hypothetical protein
MMLMANQMLTNMMTANPPATPVMTINMLHYGERRNENSNIPENPGPQKIRQPCRIS